MKNKRSTTLLAIETSCDETAAAVLAIVPGNPWPKIKTLSSVVKSQIALHSKMGGVVPEAAARAHVKNILPVVKLALSKVNCQMSNVDYFAVTAGPGLIPSLIVGVEFAKGLAYAEKKPIIPVNHMLGHLYSPFGGVNSKFSARGGSAVNLIYSGGGEIRNPSPSFDGTTRRMTVSKQIKKSKIQNTKQVFPNISIIVSGGHTLLVLMRDAFRYKVIGGTVDDAAGEAFDKVAKLLGLPYPGGPEISKLAEKGNADAINFPRPMIHSKDYNFSFAGLKTAVLYYLQGQMSNVKDPALSKTKGQMLNVKCQMSPSDICASFQQAAIDVLVAKTMRAVKEFNAKSVSLSGGVSANKALRHQLNVKCQMLKVAFMAPAKNLSTDNAEMIGIAAAFMLAGGYKPKSYKQVKADPNLQL